VQRTGYSESAVETGMAALKLETDTTALKLETDMAEFTSGQLLCQEISKQERYSVD
jgi:hypothetical protein